MPTAVPSLARAFERLSLIEAMIGHLKSDHRLGRNFLRGRLDDELNVLLAAVGWNIMKLIRFFSDLMLALATVRWERSGSPRMVG